MYKQIITPKSLNINLVNDFYFDYNLLIFKNLNLPKPTFNKIVKIKKTMTIYTLSGGTGLIGKQLIDNLIAEGHEIKVLTRGETKIKASSKINYYHWDIGNHKIESGALDCDYLIHLAGAGIADKPWTAARKKEIVESRTKSTQLIFNTIEKAAIKPKAIIAASAIGYYGTVTTNEIFNEESLPGDGFLAEVVKLWEGETSKFKTLNIRTVQLRIGIVLAKGGGALTEMTGKPVLAALGHGKQFMPWIHIADLTNMMVFAAHNHNLAGVYNAVAPEYITNDAFTKLLAKHSGKWMLPFNAPSLVLKLMLGDLANLVLEGSKVSAQKILDVGFPFQFAELNNALQDIYKVRR